MAHGGPLHTESGMKVDWWNMRRRFVEMGWTAERADEAVRVVKSGGRVMAMSGKVRGKGAK